jgi:hypothetical protein
MTGMIGPGTDNFRANELGRVGAMRHPGSVSSLALTADVASAFARLFLGGTGATHTVIGRAIIAAGYGPDDPFDPATRTPSKEERLHVVFTAALRRPPGAAKLVEELLRGLRNCGYFDSDDPEQQERVDRLRKAWAREGWTLDGAGHLSPAGAIDLTTGGRLALDEQVARLRRGTGDPGQLLGSANDLLEAVPKFVLEELDLPVPANADFGHLWYLARDRLKILPEHVVAASPGANHVKAVLGSAWKIAEQIHYLRGKEGAGHGRTLPTGVTPEMALLMVREACSVAEFVLDALDRDRGR